MPKYSKEVSENPFLNPSKALVLYALAKTEPNNSNGLSKDIGIAQSMVYRHLMDLREYNLVQKDNTKKGAHTIKYEVIHEAMMDYFIIMESSIHYSLASLSHKHTVFTYREIKEDINLKKMFLNFVPEQNSCLNDFFKWVWFENIIKISFKEVKENEKNDK